MRLEPIEKPKGLLMRVAYWMTRRQLGKVMTPMKVLYPRMEGMLRLSYEIQKFSDTTFESLRKHFREWEIVEITWLNAVENYYNLINLPLEIESDGFCAIAQARTRSA